METLKHGHGQRALCCFLRDRRVATHERLIPTQQAVHSADEQIEFLVIKAIVAIQKLQPVNGDPDQK